MPKHKYIDVPLALLKAADGSGSYWTQFVRLTPAKAWPSLISIMVTPEARGGNAGPAYPTELLLQLYPALFQPFLPLPKPIF